jgi:hypothetical protein
MASGHIQVGPDGGGKNMDADSLVSNETGSPTVYREDVVIADPGQYANKAAVEGDAFLNRFITRDPITMEQLMQTQYLIVRELAAIRKGIGILIGQPLFTDDQSTPGDGKEFTH